MHDESEERIELTEEDYKNKVDTCDICIFRDRILRRSTRRLGAIGLDKVNTCEACKTKVPKESREYAKFFLELNSKGAKATEQQIDEYIKLKQK